MRASRQIRLRAGSRSRPALRPPHRGDGTMRTRTTLPAATVVAAGALLGRLTFTHLTPDSQARDNPAAQKSPHGFPAADEVQRLYDEADLNRAVQMYRFFYPTVSGAAIFKGGAENGVVDNKVFTIIDSKPRHVGFTYNSDTPYCFAQLDL